MYFLNAWPGSVYLGMQDEFIFSKSINFIYFNTIKEKNYMSILIDENIDKI